MNNQFVTYEIALKMKELGFDEECLGNYGEKSKDLFIFPDSQLKRLTIKAPLWQQAIDWLREKYNQVICIYASGSGYNFEIHDNYEHGGTSRYDSGFTGPNDGGCWDKYEEVREAAILKALELCEKK